VEAAATVEGRPRRGRLALALGVFGAVVAWRLVSRSGEPAWAPSPPVPPAPSATPRPDPEPEPDPESAADKAASERPYGAGSAAPLEDGSAPEGFAIKGNTNSKLFHTEDSPYYSRTKAGVWFETEADAERAGFTRWDKNNGG